MSKPSGLRKNIFTLLGLAAIIICGVLIWRSLNTTSAQPQTGGIVLVLPDNLPAENQIYAQAWLDAAREEGILLQTVTASEFIRHGMSNAQPYSAIILPDTVHRSMTSSFVNVVKEFVKAGGALMQVYDAGMLNERGFYVDGSSRMSELAGVPYGLYQTMRDNMDDQAIVYGQPEFMASGLHIPPGRWIVQDGRAVLSGYGNDILRYSVMRTQGNYDGRVLMQSDDHSIIAGERAMGRGKVLFVNLPLGYLKLRTDGVLLHGFLHYFADVMLQQPQLSPAPDGIGGLVLNWHCDAAICINATDQLIRAGVFKRGPFSFHITAGPDQRKFGDGLGTDMDHNPEFSEVVRNLMREGNEIGSHGGWIHDWFGLNVSEDNQSTMEEYLAKNETSIEALTGKPQTEYSAPTGNQPEWVTRWLDEHHVKAYYFTGNIGQGPTRTYRNGRRDAHIWAFPVQTYGQYSTIEEAYMDSIPEAKIAAWLKSLVEFTADNGEVRLIYFHPPGAVRYIHAINTLMQTADAEQAKHLFQWRTMTQMADFLDRREETRWSLASEGNDVRMTAKNPISLEHQAWLFPMDRYTSPRVESGQGSIGAQGNNWKVVAGPGKSISILTTLHKQ